LSNDGMVVGDGNPELAIVVHVLKQSGLGYKAAAMKRRGARSRNCRSE
jgi:hypothetical protein